MAYTKARANWADGSAGATPILEANLDTIEQGIFDAAATADTANALAAAAIPKSIIDAAGDLIVGSGADTSARLAKGADGTWLRVAGGAVQWTTIALADIPMTGATEGEVLTSISGVAAWTAAAGGGGITKIAEVALSGSQTTIDFSSIASTYFALRLVGYVRVDGAGTTYETVNMRFNNDSGANYGSQVHYASAGVPASNEMLAQTAARCAMVPQGASGANLFSSFTVEIPNYAQAVNKKTYLADSFALSGLTTGLLERRVIGGVWDSTAAINRVTLLPATAANFVSGSRVAMYGIS